MTRKKPTKEESLHMARIAEMPCAVANQECRGRITVAHCGTFMGGGRDHFKTIPLCWEHHLGKRGVDGKQMGKRVWESIYGTEEQLLARTRESLGMADA